MTQVRLTDKQELWLATLQAERNDEIDRAIEFIQMVRKKGRWARIHIESGHRGEQPFHAIGDEGWERDYSVPEGPPHE